VTRDEAAHGADSEELRWRRAYYDIGEIGDCPQSGESAACAEDDPERGRSNQISLEGGGRSGWRQREELMRLAGAADSLRRQDDLCAWNGMCISAHIEAACAGLPRWRRSR